MANPPSLTPEQRQARAREGRRRAPPAGRGEGQAEDRFADVSASCSKQADRGDESGRHAREAEGRQRARVAPRRRQGERDPAHARARHHRHPPARRRRPEAARAAAPRRRRRRLPPRAAERPAQARTGAPHSRGASCSSSPARPAPGRARSAGCSGSGTRRCAGRSRGRPGPAGPDEVDGVDYHFVSPRGVRAAPRRRRLPRVVRGLRRPQGHAQAVRRRRARRRPRRACSRSTSRARSRSARRCPDALLVFVQAPSRDEQRRRLEARGSRDRRRPIERRLARAEAEEAARPRRSSTPSS